MTTININDMSYFSRGQYKISDDILKELNKKFLKIDAIVCAISIIFMLGISLAFHYCSPDNFKFSAIFLGFGLAIIVCVLVLREGGGLREEDKLECTILDN